MELYDVHGASHHIRRAEQSVREALAVLRADAGLEHHPHAPRIDVARREVRSAVHQDLVPEGGQPGSHLLVVGLDSAVRAANASPPDEGDAQLVPWCGLTTVQTCPPPSAS